MEECEKFPLKQIVWAKASHFPWWPAKVVKIMNQTHRKLYKVNFFGDPTYSYLQQQSLLDFDTGLLSSELLSGEFKLEKPMQLAKIAAGKINNNILKEKEDWKMTEKCQNKPETQENKTQQAKIIEENQEKFDASESCKEEQLANTSSDLFFSHITTNNVVQLLESQSFRGLQQLKGYTQRKNIGEIHKKLKAKLLQKYKLNGFGKLSSNEQLKVKGGRKIFIRKIKKNRKDKTKEKCIRKLYKIMRLRDKNEDNKRIILETVSKIQFYEEDEKKYRQAFRPLLFFVHHEKNFKIEEEEKATQMVN